MIDKLITKLILFLIGKRSIAANIMVDGGITITGRKSIVSNCHIIGIPVRRPRSLIDNIRLRLAKWIAGDMLTDDTPEAGISIPAW